MAVGSRRARHQVTFGVLSLGVAAFALLQSLVIPVLTTVQHQLHTTQGAATWVLTAYLLAASIMTPILGRVGDMIGKERVFVATLIALAVGSVLAAVASSIGVMIVARLQENAFSSTDCEFLKQLGEHVALAAHQAQLRDRLQRAYDDLRQSQESAMQQERLKALGQMASVFQRAYANTQIITCAWVRPLK